jgi:hypothetical protein
VTLARGRTRAATAAPRIQFAAIGLNHGHIYGQCKPSLAAAAGWSVLRDQPRLIAQFEGTRRSLARAAGSERPEHQARRQRLDRERPGAARHRVMKAGKDFMSDKPAMMGDGEVRIQAKPADLFDHHA